MVLAFARLRRNRAAMASLSVFLIIVLACLSAPLYARWAGVDPFTSTLDAVIHVDGVEVPVMEPSTEGLGLGYTPIGRPGNPATTSSARTTRAATSWPACSTAG